MEGAANTTWIVLFILVVFPIFFSALWIGVTLAMSFIGGWRNLARHYPAAEKPLDGRELRHVTGMLGVASYKHVLTVVTTAEGLYIANRKVFRLAI
jgi:hypothetical protein